MKYKNKILKKQQYITFEIIFNTRNVLFILLGAWALDTLNLH